MGCPQPWILADFVYSGGILCARIPKVLFQGDWQRRAACSSLQSFAVGSSRGCRSSQSRAACNVPPEAPSHAAGQDARTQLRGVMKRSALNILL